MLYWGGLSGSSIFSCVYDWTADFYVMFVSFFFLYSCFVIHLKFDFEWFQSHIGRGLAICRVYCC